MSMHGNARVLGMPAVIGGHNEGAGLQTLSAYPLRRDCSRGYPLTGAPEARGIH